MESVVLILDFFPSLFFFLLALRRKGDRGYLLAKSAVAVFFLALLTSPVALAFFPLTVQCVLCAGLFLLQFTLIYISLIKHEKKMPC